MPPTVAVRAGAEQARPHAAERGGPGRQLTAAEARIAEPVGGGAAHRKVAAELFTTVETEGTLSRVYRKAGVRWRTARGGAGVIHG